MRRRSVSSCLQIWLLVWIPALSCPITTGTVQLKQHWFLRPHPRGTQDFVMHFGRSKPPGETQKRVRRSRRHQIPVRVAVAEAPLTETFSVPRPVGWTSHVFRRRRAAVCLAREQALARRAAAQLQQASVYFCGYSVAAFCKLFGWCAQEVMVGLVAPDPGTIVAFGKVYSGRVPVMACCRKLQSVSNMGVLDEFRTCKRASCRGVEVRLGPAR